MKIKDSFYKSREERISELITFVLVSGSLTVLVVVIGG